MPITKKRPEKASAKSGASKKPGKEADAAKGQVSTAGAEAEETAADILRKDGIVTTFALSSKKMHRNVRDISVSNLTVTFHGTPLVEEAELTLNYGNRYGFIGRNGCGKSTFMRVIGARCFPIPDGIDIFHLKEEIEATDMTAKEAVMSVDVERARLEEEAEELNNMMAEEAEGSENSEDYMERLTQIYERLEQMDAATAEVRASKILSGLGFTPDRQMKKTKEFSGGWRMRIALARALFIQPTLLLLDEPTNHLDMDAVVWLEDYLAKWDKILFFVSHSQDFMNNVCTHIVHLSQKKLLYYSGNYDSFVNTRAEREEEQEKRYKAEQDQIKHMKEYVARFGQGNAKMARQAQSKEKTLEKMLRSGLTDKVTAERALDFKFLDPGKLAPPVLQCNDLTFGYPGGAILYSGVDFGIDLDSRIALVGPNGAGKSTLLKLLTGDLQPIRGDVRPHAHLRISKFSQHFIDVLDLDANPLDYFMSLWPDMTREDARKFLGRYGISGSVQTQVMSQLSDGQKSRVVLAKMARENPHLLFLDEPTNHLDMESIDSLAKAINGFSGGLVLVSHDMRLISQVAREIWMCDNMTVTRYAGEISDFKMQLRHQLQRSNLLSGGDASSAANVPLVPLVPLTPLSTKPIATAGAAAIVPAVVRRAPADNNDFPPLGAAQSEDDLIRKARLELAELAIARQRARKAGEDGAVPPVPFNSQTVNGVTNIETSFPAHEGGQGCEAGDEAGDGDSDEQARVKAEEKEKQRAKRRAEREAKAAQEKREEEEKQRRREEKLRDMEEAKKLKEQQQKEYEEFLVQKAAKDAKLKAEADAAAEVAVRELAKRREEKEQRRLAKLAAKAEREEKVRHEAEERVLADPWNQQQQDAFEGALLDLSIFACSKLGLDKIDKWTRIAARVGEKTPNQCLARYRFLKEYVAKQKKLSNEVI